MVGARTRCKTYFDGPNGFKKRKIFIFDELTDLESCESFCKLATFKLFHLEMMMMVGRKRHDDARRVAPPSCPSSTPITINLLVVTHTITSPRELFRHIVNLWLRPSHMLS